MHSEVFVGTYLSAVVSETAIVLMAVKMVVLDVDNELVRIKVVDLTELIKGLDVTGTFEVGEVLVVVKVVDVGLVPILAGLLEIDEVLVETIGLIPLDRKLVVKELEIGEKLVVPVGTAKVLEVVETLEVTGFLVVA